ncbi:MAG: UvrD-helicase domain-containing protein, partial [Hydrogenovibrio sp.]
MSEREFDPIAQPFVPGITRIEASAGTGKTYSISYLVLRLVVEEGLEIDQILTVTFTKAATEELKERIRRQLYKARQAYDQPPENDETLQRWIATRQDTVVEDKQRLTNALANIDQAGIFTIHSFCQRVLTEFPLESQQAFKLEVTDDLRDLKMQVVQDFWRQQVYELPPSRARLLKKTLSSPQALYDWLQAVGDDEVTLVPDPPADIDTLWQTYEQHAPRLTAWRQSVLPGLVKWRQQHQSVLVKAFDTALAAFDKDYGKFLDKTAFLNMVSKAKGKWTAKDQTLEEQRDQFWQAFQAEMQPPSDAYAALTEAEPLLEAGYKKACRAYYLKELKARQAQQGLIGFNDLVLNLANLLKDETQRPPIVNAMQSRYQAALIDEFQDTDADQWRIFKAFFATGAHYLYLIGDPKQAIYRFRGADIDTYLAAARSADVKLTLAHNWRSRPRLVEAVNALFSQVPQPFQMDGLAFHPVRPGLVDADVKPVEQCPFRAWEWPDPESKRSAEAQDALIQRNVCQDILQQLHSGQRRPGDFAVLVRSHSRAEATLNALGQLGIPAVVKSKQSVFQTEEANTLRRVMRAVLQPSRLQLAQEALSEPLFGLTAQAYFQVLQSDSAFLEQWMLSLSHAHDVWLDKGFMPAMMDFFERQDAFQTISRLPYAERRITNLLHCMEWLQQTVLDEVLTPIQTLHALENAMQEGSTEATELRLESDAKAVQVVTIHAAKGLQYPVVYCPDLYKPKKPNSRTKAHKVKINGHWQVSADAAGKEALKRLAEEDLQAEDLRLTYVALTRAEDACVVVMPPQLGGKKSDGSSLSRLLPDGVPAVETIAVETMALLDSEALQGYSASDGADLDFERLAEFSRRLDTRYRLTSFSRLSQARQDQVQEDARGKAEDEIALESEQEAADEMAAQMATQMATQSPQKTPLAMLPRGAHFGNLVHDLLEHSDFRALVTGPDETLVRVLCQKYGVTEMLASHPSAGRASEMNAQMQPKIDP